MNVSPSSWRRALLDGPDPLHRRLTLLSTIAVAVTLIAVCLTGWVALRVTLFHNSEGGSLLIARDLAVSASQDLATSGGLSAQVLGPGSSVVEAVGSNGTVLRTPGEDVILDVGLPEVLAAQQQRQSVRNTTSSSGETYRIVTVPLNEPGYVLVVGRPLTSSYEILHVFGLVVLIVGSVGLVWAWLVGRAVAKAAFRPILSFTEAVRHVVETEDMRPVSTGHERGILATLTDTFNQMLVRLSESRDQQNRLVTDASHELRTPLTSIRTNIELLSLDASKHRLDDAARAKILHDMQTQTVELGALVGDLLLLTREHTPLWEPVDLRTVVQAAVERVRRRGPELVFDVDLSPLDLIGDEGSLERAVTNLLNNAVKWSPPGGTIRIRLDGHQLHIADQGPGIADADLPHIFDRFYRADAARSTPGTGLGLPVADKVIRDHGGTIHAESPPDGGAHFTIHLPGTFDAASPVLAARGAPRPLTDAAAR